MASRAERLASLAVAVSALAIAGTVVYRQIVPAPAPPAAHTVTISYLDDWRDLLPTGRQVAEGNAPVQLIEFIDLECPGCQAFATVLGRLREAYGPSLGVTLIHYPLPMHRHAMQAARVAECGAPEDAFDELVRIILGNRDSLHLGRWMEYAAAAGVRDSAAFRRCQEDTAGVAMIDHGVQAGDRIRIRATPTVIVNGWRFSTVPVERELKQAIDALLAGQTPPFPVR